MPYTDTLFTAPLLVVSAKLSFFVDGEFDATFRTDRIRSANPHWDETFYYYGCVLTTSMFLLLGWLTGRQ